MEVCENYFVILFQSFKEDRKILVCNFYDTLIGYDILVSLQILPKFQKDEEEILVEEWKNYSWLEERGTYCKRFKKNAGLVSKNRRMATSLL